MISPLHADQTEARLDELLERWEELQEQGESRSPEELCSTCPELAGELARRIARLCAFNAFLTDAPVKAGGREAAAARAEYSDLRFHAAGGLGEVFLAREAGLNREVALKFLKPGRSGDALSQRRFLLEAEVTGRLEHPGVVPIYTRGTDDSGAPCYAMRFIRGTTLQDALNTFHAAERPGRDPAERSLALRDLLNRFVSVCNTVAYAHSRGILHRDLKPQNIMLGQYDETLVVDWGLAKPFERDKASDGAGEEALTPSSGSGTPTLGVVGTLQYMSPEQAREQPAEVGPASDLFSLGAILYAILTGEAPYRGGAHGEILEQVRRCEFPAPGRIGPAAPRALAAICLKAMAARPADRYATALELAADVKRWLADEPVTAWHEPIGLRVGRWRRRHRTLVTSAAAVLVFGLAALAGFATVLASKNRELDTTNVALVHKNQELDKQRRRAEAREDLAIAAVKKFRDVVQANAVLKNQAELGGLRQALLKEPIEFFRKLCEELRADSATRPDALTRLAGASFDLAETTSQFGSLPDAIQSHSEALAVREQLARENPAVASYQSDLAGSHNVLGNMLTNTGQRAQALESFRRALEILERIARDNPAVTEYQRDLATVHNNIGKLQYEMGQPAQALESYRGALATFRRLVDLHADVNEYQSYLAWSHNNIGALLADTGRPAEALQSHRQALEIFERLAHDNPTIDAFHHDLAVSRYNIGKLLAETNHPAEALESYRRTLVIRERLARDYPSATLCLSELAACLTNIGDLLKDTKPVAQALESYRRAVEIWERLAHDNPSVHSFQSYLGFTLERIAEIEIGQGRLPEAREKLERAIKHQRAALAAMPRQPFYQQALKFHLLNLAKVHQAQNRLDHGFPPDPFVR